MKSIVFGTGLLCAAVAGVKWLRRKKRQRQDNDNNDEGKAVPLDEHQGAIVPFRFAEEPKAPHAEFHDNRKEQPPMVSKSIFFQLMDACCETHAWLRRGEPVAVAAVSGSATLILVDTATKAVYFTRDSFGAGRFPSSGDGFLIMLSDSTWRNVSFDAFLLLLADAASHDLQVSQYPTLVACWFELWGVTFPPGFQPFRMASLADVF